jgi:hypothetical protein
MSVPRLCQLGMLMIVAGCASQPNKDANSGPDVVCHSVDAVGSLITKSVCTTRAERAEQQAQLDEVRRQVQSGADAPSKPQNHGGPN